MIIIRHYGCGLSYKLFLSNVAKHLLFKIGITFHIHKKTFTTFCIDSQHETIDKIPTSKKICQYFGANADGCIHNHLIVLTPISFCS